MRDELAAAARRRESLIQKLAEATEEVKRLTLEAVENGVTEERAAARAGVTRMTVRDWRGKPRTRRAAAAPRAAEKKASAKLS